MFIKKHDDNKKELEKLRVDQGSVNKNRATAENNLNVSSGQINHKNLNLSQLYQSKLKD